MNEFQGERPVCQSLDPATLAALADHELEWAIVDYVNRRLAGRGAAEDEAAIINALPPGVRALYLTRTVESEVIDGGFVGYFRRWAGPFASEAVTAFEFFSAHEYASLMREANRVHAEECGTTYVSDGRELIDSAEPWRLQVLEEYFHQIDESLSALRIHKIRSEPELFCTDHRGGDVAGA